MTAGVEPRAVVLVEGESDRVALAALAARRGRDLVAEGVLIVPMGGVTNIGRFLDRYGPAGLDLRLAGLTDAGEERHVRRGLARAGLGADLTRAEMAALGFAVCVDDLEDELIRAHGIAGMERVIEAAGELPSLRRLQRQPAQLGRRPEDQLHRFISTRSGRKAVYARLLVDALPLDRIPEPLDRVLAQV